jgi:hypothetical protein
VYFGDEEGKPMDIEQLLNLVDTLGVVVLSFYIIQKGMDQLKELLTMYNGFVQAVLTQQQANNQSLSDLVSDLCQK